MKKITVLVFLLIIATVAVVMIMLNVTKYDSVSTINKDQGELNVENKNFIFFLILIKLLLKNNY